MARYTSLKQLLLVWWSTESCELLKCLQDLARDTSLSTKLQLLIEEQRLMLRLVLAKKLALALTRSQGGRHQHC